MNVCMFLLETPCGVFILFPSNISPSSYGFLVFFVATLLEQACLGEQCRKQGRLDQEGECTRFLGNVARAAGFVEIQRKCGKTYPC
jgi:hypothetical protein